MDPAKTLCGLRAANLADGSCVAVGPADPTPESAAAFVRSVDGWGITAKRGDAGHCSAGEMALLGEDKCVPVDDCSRAFPPTNADVVVSTKMTGANVVATLAEAMNRAHPGSVVAIDSGTYLSLSVTTNVTLVGRCARDTVVGDGEHNALYVNGGHITVSGVTLSSSASPIAVASGTVDADSVIVQRANVGVAAVGKGAKLNLRHSLIVGLGTNESLGAMAGGGGTVALEDVEIRSATNGVLATDPGSKLTVKRGVVNVVDGGAKSSGIEASAQGHVELDDTLVHSESARLAAVHDDVGTSASATASSGTMVIRTSVLEQAGVELKDAPAVDVEGQGGDMTLTDVTLRHQALIGILVSTATLHMSRVAILGEKAAVQNRSAFSVAKGAAVVADSIAIPWAQGAAVMVDTKADLDLQKSLIANNVARGSGQSAILVSEATASISDCELADNERSGVIAISGSTIAGRNAFIHGSHAPEDSTDKGGVFGVIALHTTATFENCAFENNVEAIAAAGGSVAVTGTSIKTHKVGLRAMDGMAIVENTSDLTPNAIAIAQCTFENDDQRTSLETLPELNAPVGTQPGATDP
jgi:hypothetical protein